MIRRFLNWLFRYEDPMQMSERWLHEMFGETKMRKRDAFYQ